MWKLLAIFNVFIALPSRVAYGQVLIVADEFPAMESLAAGLRSEEHIESNIISQTNLPRDLHVFSAVVVYIHGALSEAAEAAFIDYATKGGKLVLLHHSISSAKRKNAHWFQFLGVELPEGELVKGGYKWIEGVRFELVNMNQNHFIMTNQVAYPERVAYATSNSTSIDGLPGFRLEHTEVYLNHVHTEPRTILMGLKYKDEKTSSAWMQDKAGWIKTAGKGQVIYLMPGHTRQDFEDPTYRRIVLNALIYKP
jgi:hypothetical protein